MTDTVAMTPSKTALQATPLRRPRRPDAVAGVHTDRALAALGRRGAERLPVSRPAVSQHLKVLADAGLVQRESIGTRNLYRPDTDGIATMRDFIDSLWDVGLARFKAHAEALARSRAAIHPKEKP